MAFTEDKHYGQAMESIALPYIRQLDGQHGRKLKWRPEERDVADFHLSEQFTGDTLLCDVKSGRKYTGLPLELWGRDYSEKWAYTLDRVLFCEAGWKRWYWVGLKEFRELPGAFKKLECAAVQTKSGYWVSYVPFQDLKDLGCAQDVSSAVHAAYFAEQGHHATYPTP